jgi:uroporphyrinogen-III synthase
MARSLDGLRILVPETRELDLFVSMLEAEGARALRCPLVRILDLDDAADAEAWIERLVAGEYQDVIWLTGEGLRRLLSIAERSNRGARFVDAVKQVRSITRGPKPARVLRELGIAPGLAARQPTSQGVLDALAGEDIAGRAIGVQLYPGDGAAPLVAALNDRHARVFPVTPYRYASEADAAQVTNAIHELCARRIDMIAFTSSPQVERLFEVARASGLEQLLTEMLAQIRVAAIGPVVEEALHHHGVATVLRPESTFHLKPLVRVIAAAWSAQ